MNKIKRFLAVLLLCTWAPTAFAQKRSPLAAAPDWAQLEPFQDTMLRSEFEQLLHEVYAPDKAAAAVIQITEREARIVKQFGKPETFNLRFAPHRTALRPPPRYWTPARALPPANPGKPLSGLKIALDPGHIGGDWAKIEERWFQIGQAEPVREGNMTLRVARMVAPRLEAAGAEVFLVRATEEPVTQLRPDQLTSEATAALQERGVLKPKGSYEGSADPAKETSVRWESEKLFYRISEIRRRADLVNEIMKPDLAVCIHFNAEAWGNPSNPELVPRNHLHLLVNGNYSAGELAYDDVRFDMLIKLLNRSYQEELDVSEMVAAVFAQETQLPPYYYTTPNAKLTGVTGFVWTRNLLANRLFECPVVFLEPYVMNSPEVFERVQLGEYEGLKAVGGRMRRNIYQEYSDALVEGLLRYYASIRPQ